MLLSFTLSSAFMIWQRKERVVDTRLETRPAPGARERTGPSAALRGVAPAPSASAASASAMAAAPVVSPPAVAPTAQPAVAPAAAAVSVNVWNRRRLGTIEGRVINKSDKPLTVVLEGKDRGGVLSASVFFELNPGEQKSFGTDDGLQLEGGGVVVARVVGFPDQEFGIPP